MSDLAVILPFVNEWPQVTFTIRCVAEQLIDEIDFEIVAIDNWCQEAAEQNREPDKGHDRLNTKGEWEKSAIASWAGRRKWLKHLKYEEKLSHWNAKRVGVQASEAPVLLFLDAHVVPGKNALISQYRWFQVLQKTEGPDVTLHLPLTYHILEDHRLVYRLVDERKAGNIHYSFCGYHPAKEPYEVAVMSTCGMMMLRETYEKLGGWPKELGIYGGGENFMNFVGAICGIRKFIVPERTLHHHGDKRGYNFTYDDSLRNRAIANYLFGDEKYLDRWLEHKKGREEVKHYIREDVVRRCAAQREHVRTIAVTNIDTWLDEWHERLQQQKK